MAKKNRTAALKKLLWAHSQWTVDELMAAMNEQGFTTTKSTVQTIKADWAHSLKCLREIGALPAPLLSQSKKKGGASLLGAAPFSV